jgi:hypothetical protein
MLFLILGLILVLLVSGGGLLYYSSVYVPGQQHVAASATALAATQVQQNKTGTAVAQITGTAVDQTAVAQSTIQAQQAAYTQATSGNPAITDPLSKQSNTNWDLYDAEGGGGCAFTNGTLHSSIQTKGFYVPCLAQGSNYANFALEVDVTVVKGEAGGMIFRSDDKTANSYALYISTDGYYYLNLRKNDQGQTLHSRASTAIHKGEGQSNTLTLIARGSDLSIYINKQFVLTTNDTSLTSGRIGLAGILFKESTAAETDAAFKNLHVWKL